MLFVLNLPLVGMWAQLLRLPYNVLFPLIVLFSIVGVYCSSNNVFDVYVMLPLRQDQRLPQVVLELTTFLTRPISAACLIFAAVLLVFPLLPSLRSIGPSTKARTRGAGS